MNKAKRVAWQKHRAKSKKLKEKQHQQAQAQKSGSVTAVPGRR